MQFDFSLAIRFLILSNKHYTTSVLDISMDIISISWHFSPIQLNTDAHVDNISEHGIEYISSRHSNISNFLLSNIDWMTETIVSLKDHSFNIAE